jgi:hypothetical protein
VDTLSVSTRFDFHGEAIQLAHAIERESHSGWDPYDALASPYVRGVARGRLGRRLAIQLTKRSPINPRRPLGVPQFRHLKGIALCASAYAALSRLGAGETYRSRAVMLAEEVASRSIALGDGVGWGYDFDVQTRWGFYPRGVPNAIATVFAAHALLDAAELVDDDRLSQLAGRSVRFAEHELWRPQPGFFAYHSASNTPIHNASLLVAGLIARCEPEGSEALANASRAVAFHVRCQRANGSWPYGEAAGLEWIDGYHTAYNVLSLARWSDRCSDSAAGGALERGLGFYVTHLFDPDGAPRATDRDRYPIDIHAAASAIWALSLLRNIDPRALGLAERVADWSLSTMRRSDGRFAFQKHRRYRNSVPYFRWSDAHMLLALSTLASVGSQDGG